MKDKTKLSAAIGERTSFDLDLNNYREDYGRLLNARSVSPLEKWLNQPITEQSIADCLSFFYEDLPVAVLLYFHEEDQLKTWLLNREGIQFDDSIPLKATTLSVLEDELRQGLIQGSSLAKDTKTKRMGRISTSPSKSKIDVSKVIAELSTYLLPANLVNCLEALAIEHLIVVPSLNIQQIPLAILKLPNANEQFIDRWSHSLAFSLFELADLMLKTGTRDAKEKISVSDHEFEKDNTLFVGNPGFASTTEWSLASLPGAETEVREICQDMRVPEHQILIGKAATKAAVLEKSKNAWLLYFATHGIASERDPLDGSGLFLTPSESDESGLWTAREIQSMELEANMVILSACQTGLGAAQDAGVIGLSRAFHLAGAKSVLTSLWSVDDMTTKELMKTFMRKLLEPQYFFPAAHLRQAMLTFRAENPSPYHWAAFTVMGIA